jgi:microcystin-dependent protein
MDPILGTIIMFAGNFEPRGWAFCNGQTLGIAQNSALFSLLGTMYGGDGVTTFQLPDLRGRVPMHPGNGNGLTPRVQGEMPGTETVTLTQAQMPQHSHDLNVSNIPGDNDRPSGDYLARSQIYSANGTVLATLNPLTLSAAGGNQPHANIQPSLCVQFIIALEGIFPSRN